MRVKCVFLCQQQAHTCISHKRKELDDGCEFNNLLQTRSGAVVLLAVLVIRSRWQIIPFQRA